MRPLFAEGVPCSSDSLILPSIQQFAKPRRLLVAQTGCQLFGRQSTQTLFWGQSTQAFFRGQALQTLLDGNRVFTRECIGWEFYDGNFPLFNPDEPLTPEDMHTAVRKIMGRFYRFRDMFAVARNVIVFPAMIFSLWKIKLGWQIWYRYWRNAIMRFGGWIILRRWITQFKKGTFGKKLSMAKARLTADESQS